MMRLLRVALPFSSCCRALMHISTYYGARAVAVGQKGQGFWDKYGLWWSVAIVKSYDALSFVTI